jgi:glyoxylase-like metal-dependent hydrolase (beta-lactamase superfamily II)
MIDPARLVAGTKAVYGEELAAKLYGDIQAIEAARIDIAEDGEAFSLRGREMRALYTEGHARHHYCLSDPSSGGVFTGDSFGVSYRELDTAAGEFIFPTSTPIHFDPEEAHKSVDRIMSLQPQRLYLTHYSKVEHLERLATDMHKGIDAYVAMARKHAQADDRAELLRAEMFEYFVAGLEEHGFKGGRDMMWSILSLDVNLNVQGIEVWLDNDG